MLRTLLPESLHRNHKVSTTPCTHSIRKKYPLNLWVKLKFFANPVDARDCTPFLRFNAGIRVLLIIFLTLNFQLEAAPQKIIAKGFFADKALLQIDGEIKLLSKGETFRGIKLLSSSGRGAVVRLSDGREIKLELNRAIGSSYVKAKKSKTNIYPDKLGMYSVNGKINQHPVNFLVDTGATSITLSSDLAKQLRINYRRGRKGFAQTANAVVPVWNIQLASVSVGDITLRNVEASVLEGNSPVQVLLGNSFLKHVSMQRKGVMMQLQKKY